MQRVGVTKEDARKGEVEADKKKKKEEAAPVLQALHSDTVVFSEMNWAFNLLSLCNGILTLIYAWL